LKKINIKFQFQNHIQKMETTISLPKKNNYNKDNSFNKYVGKEIFGNILSFLPKEYSITKRPTCKNWNEISTNEFLKNILGPFTRPYNISYLNNFDCDDKNIVKISNKLCSYGYYDKNMKIINDNSEPIKIFRINKYTRKITGNKILVWHILGCLVINNHGKIKAIKLDDEPIDSITTDDNYIYVLKKKNNQVQYGW